MHAHHKPTWSVHGNRRGRIALLTRGRVDDTQMNFPESDYTDEEVPTDIEALEQAIKHLQVIMFDVNLTVLSRSDPMQAVTSATCQIAMLSSRCSNPKMLQDCMLHAVYT